MDDHGEQAALVSPLGGALPSFIEPKGAHVPNEEWQRVALGIIFISEGHSAILGEMTEQVHCGSSGRRRRAESRTRYLFRERAQRRGWDVRHPDRGGSFLEENEIVHSFPALGLFAQRPDFLTLLGGLPVMVVEAKNDISKLDVAIAEACEYAERINGHGNYNLRVAVGVAGEEDGGFALVVRFLTGDGQWKPLTSRGAELTALPSPKEIEAALAANDATSQVSIPEQSEFIDAAIELSLVLRQAKIEPVLRPKVIGALVAAIHSGPVETSETTSLQSVNALLKQTLDSFQDVPSEKRERLLDALRLSGADFNRLAPFIRRIVNILERLNIRAVLLTDTDFLGIFYEAFLRYGYDSNALGIVFTPRHITRLAAKLSAVEPNHKIIDIASGTGGFLIAAFELMREQAISPAQREIIREHIYAFDTNPTIWALASLNMFFRGDGKSHIENASSLDTHVAKQLRRQFDRAFLNPPFSQVGEPERDFIDASMEALAPGGILVAVVLAGVFADEEHKSWRKRFLRSHTLLGMISLPEDLFYPVAAPTSILIAQAHVPHGNHAAWMARIENDGYEKLKGRRIPCAGEQLSHLEELFALHRSGESFSSDLAATCPAFDLLAGDEWSPQQWLPQPLTTAGMIQDAQHEVIRSIFRAVAQFPSLAERALDDFGKDWLSKPSLPQTAEIPLSELFTLKNGASSGEKNFPEGSMPYISSGDALNSIVRLVLPMDEQQVFRGGAITVTAFGLASVQPWDFLARGNGGSSVRVLTPKVAMSIRELVWFAAQINLQRWRFFYLRQAILGRLRNPQFRLHNVPVRLPDGDVGLAEKLRRFRASLEEQSTL